MTPVNPDKSPFRPDVPGNRAAQKWSRRALVGRILWELVRTPLFAWSPRPLWSWRRTLLRAFGARIGANVRIHPTVEIAIPWNLCVGADVGIGHKAILYALGEISIGAGSTVSQYAHLCAGTHDHTSRDFALKKSPIAIGEGVWVCADAFVGPGVRVGDGAIIAARAVAMRDVDNAIVVAGNPARTVGERPPFLDLDEDGRTSQPI